MYAYFQPKMLVEQEEADIKEMIDEEYNQREQENLDYYHSLEDFINPCAEKYYIFSVIYECTNITFF